MMMKKKFVAVALSAVCLLSAVGCGQQSASTASSASSVSSSVASSASASQVMDAEDYLSGISGTYVELFPEMAKSESIPSLAPRACIFPVASSSALPLPAPC